MESKGLDERSEIYGDNLRTYQILSNLLSNAIRFTLQGSITVIVSIDDTRFLYNSPLSLSLFCLFPLFPSILVNLFIVKKTITWHKTRLPFLEITLDGLPLKVLLSFPLPLPLPPPPPPPHPLYFVFFFFDMFWLFSFHIFLTFFQDPKKRQCRASSRCKWWIRESEWMTRSKGGSSNASRKPTTGPPKYVRGRERREEVRRERVKQYWLISYYCRNMVDLVWGYPYPSYCPSFSRYSFPFLLFHVFFLFLFDS